jgi:murein DD-endopeptidase MepM/ murein hydrolase activator NlpD
MGVHLIGNNEANLRYAEQLGAAAVKIVDPDPAVVRRVLAAIDPNGVVILRDHPMSEQKADMAADPVGTGKRHALDWIAKLTTGRFAEFGKDPRIVVVGINEPDVHNQAEEEIVLAYTLAFFEPLTAAGIRAGALNLSVGWPREPDGWNVFLPLEKVINRNRGFLINHAYWYPTPQNGWESYANRIAKCPMTVPIIIGECAYTRQLINAPQPWGWNGNLPASMYAEQLWYYHDNVDPNVFAIMPFTTGYAGAEWASKDTQPAHADILARVHPYKWPQVWPVPKTAPPQPGSDKGMLILPIYEGSVSGYYGSLYTNKEGQPYAHEGLDIPKPVGTPVYAAYDGIVAWSDNEPATYGNYIRTYHPELSVCFFYGHLSERLVETGNSIKQGQLIGKSGNTGNSTGPHIHFEVRLMNANGTYRTGVSAKSNARVDPIAFVEGWKVIGGKVVQK